MNHRISEITRSRVRLLAVTAVIGLALTACGNSDEPTSASAPADGCISDFDPNQDYFPDKSTLFDAKNFSITYENSYQILRVNEPYAKGNPESFVLVKCGAPAPELTGELASATQITVPIKSLFSSSTTHLPLVSELGQLDVLTGVSNGAFVTGDEFLDRIADGRTAEYASGGTINSEQVIAAQPDVLMTGGTDDPAHAGLRAAGIAVVPNAEWLESAALGRAEWIKMMAALTGTEKKADEVYQSIRQNYHDVVAAVADVSPTEVLLGSLYQGTWSMPSGGSYVGALMSDAGGTYPWINETASGSLKLSYETVFVEAGTAPVWLVESMWATTDDALKAEPRFGELAAVRDGQVWSATKVIGPGGGNDYYQRGVTRPDLVLGDLVAILHPDLAPDHEFTFYRQVPRP